MNSIKNIKQRILAVMLTIVAMGAGHTTTWAQTPMKVTVKFICANNGKESDYRIYSSVCDIPYDSGKRKGNVADFYYSDFDIGSENFPLHVNLYGSVNFYNAPNFTIHDIGYRLTMTFSSSRHTFTGVKVTSHDGQPCMVSNMKITGNGHWLTFYMPHADDQIGIVELDMLYNELPDEPTIALPTHEYDNKYWSSFYRSSGSYRINDDVEAFAFTATFKFNDPDQVGKVTLHKLGKVIPAGTAVVIVSNDSIVSMTRDNNAVAEHIVDNQLHGIDYDTPLNALGDGYKLVLGMDNVGFGFHNCATGELPAYKAYLLVNNYVARARSLTIETENDPK